MIAIRVPPLGESIVEATISRWLRKEGEAVAAGDTLVELETDKVTVEVPALKAGVLTKRSRQEGDVVSVGDELGAIDETIVAASAPPVAPRPVTPTSPSPSVPASPVPGSRFPVPEASALPTTAEPARVSPAAQRIADETGIALGSVAGTGRGGVVSKPDVIEYLRGTAGTAPAPAPSAPAVVPPLAPPSQQSPPAATTPVPESVRSPLENRETREKMTTRRRRIAEHLLESQHATAHLTTFNEIDMSAVETLRARVKERIEKEHGLRLSLMPFFVKAACTALKQFPVVNARIDGDAIVYHNYVNMGIAVASDAGLVVPNLKNADHMGMVQVGKTIVDVAKRARDAKLTMDDLTGGTFTITNGGVFGSLVSTPIINFPQVAILGLHKTQDRPVVVDGQIVIRPMMYVALSYDHRIIDGQHAVLFLIRVKELMEDPALLAID